MTDQHSFLEYLRANPNDNAARLGYADWLLEHATGENSWWADHAALIQSGVAMSRFVCSAHIDRQVSREYKELSDQQNHSLYRLFPTVYTWAAQNSLFRNNLAHAAQLEWDRGFISTLTVFTDTPQICSPEMIDQVALNTTVRLRDWHGIKKSLPPNNRVEIRFIKSLELPKSLVVGENLVAHTGYRGYRGESKSDTICAIQDHFGYHDHNLGEPKVEVGVWEDRSIETIRHEEYQARRLQQPSRS